MALIENNASVAAEIAVNLAKKCFQSSLNDSISKCILTSQRNPVNKTKIFVYLKKYIRYYSFYFHRVICLCHRL